MIDTMTHPMLAPRRIVAAAAMTCTTIVLVSPGARARLRADGSTTTMATTTDAKPAAPAPRPNVVFLLADDLGYADCGFNGGKQIATPELDRLAAAGTVLEAHYVQPVCSPTRAALLTGRYPMRHGLQVGVVRPRAQYGLPLAERTLAHALREVGYATAICGKWHLGSFDRAYWPNARGFEHAYGHLFGALDYFTHQRDGKLDWYRDGEPLAEEGYTTHLIARDAVRFIEKQSAAQPFFLYVPFNAVHTPLQVPERYLEPYASLPAPRRKLAGMLAALDEAVGEIVAAVEKKELRARTLFVFSSDNGGYRPGKVTDNGPLRAGKGTVYEGGVRAAAFATWDGHVPTGKRLATALHIADWYPTLLALAGATLEQPLALDGRDLWPALTRGAPSPHDEILMNTTPSGGALRAGDWKLVVQFAPRTRVESVELYDLAHDVGESRDLASSQPEKVAELRARYEKLAAQAVPPKALEKSAENAPSDAPRTPDSGARRTRSIEPRRGRRSGGP